MIIPSASNSSGTQGRRKPIGGLNCRCLENDMEAFLYLVTAVAALVWIVFVPYMIWRILCFVQAIHAEAHCIRDNAIAGNRRLKEISALP